MSSIIMELELDKALVLYCSFYVTPEDPSCASDSWTMDEESWPSFLVTFLHLSSSSEKCFPRVLCALNTKTCHQVRLVCIFLFKVCSCYQMPELMSLSCCYHNKLAYIILPYFNLTVTQSLLYTALTTTFNRVGETEIHPQITGELHRP